ESDIFRWTNHCSKSYITPPFLTLRFFDSSTPSTLRLPLQQIMNHAALFEDSQLGPLGGGNPRQFQNCRSDRRRRHGIVHGKFAIAVAGPDDAAGDDAPSGPQRTIALRPVVARRDLVDSRGASEFS